MSFTRGSIAAAVALALLACTMQAAAHDYDIKSLHIVHPYARTTPPGAVVGGAYLTIENRGTTADTLVSARSSAAGTVQIHSMSMDGGVMRMREVAGVDIPAGGKATLAPGSYHLMMLDLKQPLATGATVPITLTFAHAGSIDVEATVEAANAMAMPGMAPGMAH